MVYEVPLAEQKIRPHQVTTLHLVSGFTLMATGAFIIAVFFKLSIMPFTWQPVAENTNVDIHSVLMPEYGLLAAGVAIVYMALFNNRWLLQPQNNRIIRITELVLCLVVALYALFSNATVLAGIYAILSAAIIYSFYAESGKGILRTVSVSDEGIKLPVTSRRRYIRWAEVERVMLRYGTLTVNCLDNHLYQWNTLPNDIDAKTFEAFCTAQVEAARKDRSKSVW